MEPIKSIVRISLEINFLHLKEQKRFSLINKTKFCCYTQDRWMKLNKQVYTIIYHHFEG